jgi:hypothetical protein
MSTGTS